MSYSISHLNMHSPGENVYFFDTNIWLWLLGIEPNPSQKQEKYIEFFQKVLKTKAVIVLPAMVVSEALNRVLRVASSRYAKKKGANADSSYFKKVYRSTPDYQAKLKSLIDDLKIYSASCSLTSDRFGDVGFRFDDLLNEGIKTLEFNDLYIQHIAKTNDAIFVTDDGDFFLGGMKILTLNNVLLDRAKQKAAEASPKSPS